MRRKFPEYKLRKKDLTKVLSYVKRKTEEMRPNYVYVWDEDFLLHSKSEIVEFARLYRNIGLPFYVFATPSSVLRNANTLDALADAGLNQVNIGIQSGSERIQKELFHRRETLRVGRKATEILVDLYDMHSDTMHPPMIDFITLNPYENGRDIIASIEYAMDLPKPYYLIAHIMNFFEGTPLKQDALAKGLISETYAFDFDLHDFVNHAKAAISGMRKNDPLNIYLSSVLFRMRGVNDYVKRGMVSQDEINRLLSKEEIECVCKNLDGLIEDMDARYNPMKGT